VACAVSEDGRKFKQIGNIEVKGDQQKEEVTKTYSFNPGGTAVRYIRFAVKGTKALPKWHPSAGGASWVFIDEIVVK
jgi:hypothetical protein